MNGSIRLPDCIISRWQFFNGLRRLNISARDNFEKFFGISSRRRSSISLPFVVFMSIGIITNAPNHQAWKVVHQAGGFHLETKNIVFLSYSITSCSILHQSICRSHKSVMYMQALFGIALFSVIRNQLQFLFIGIPVVDLAITCPFLQMDIRRLVQFVQFDIWFAVFRP